jgi:hypothetical protein
MIQRFNAERHDDVRVKVMETVLFTLELNIEYFEKSVAMQMTSKPSIMKRASSQANEGIMESIATAIIKVLNDEVGQKAGQKV